MDLLDVLYQLHKITKQYYYSFNNKMFYGNLTGNKIEIRQTEVSFNYVSENKKYIKTIHYHVLYFNHFNHKEILKYNQIEVIVRLQVRLKMRESIFKNEVWNK